MQIWTDKCPETPVLPYVQLAAAGRKTADKCPKRAPETRFWT